MTNEKKAYDYWLVSTPGMGNVTIRRLLEVFGTPMEIYRATEKQLIEFMELRQWRAFQAHREQFRVWEEYQKFCMQSIAFLREEDAEYPERLRNIPDAPYGLFVKGTLPDEQIPSVAIIGARDCSEYGRYVAWELGKGLGENGIAVVSGMARGIDGISQLAALEAGGTSYGVLGCGVDICYPSQNRKLYQMLMEKGGVISTFPPGAQPRPQNFPPRNRIVSGLADVVVVVEAREKSGTLITVDMALEQGKEVYVIPGRITDKLSEGCNRLIKQGAGIILSPQDLVDEIVSGSYVREKSAETLRLQRWTYEDKKGSGVKRQNKKGTMIAVAESQKIGAVEPELRPIYQLLDLTPQSVEELARKLEVDYPHQYTIIDVSTMLFRLCMVNLAVQKSPGHFCRSSLQGDM